MTCLGRFVTLLAFMISKLDLKKTWPRNINLKVAGLKCSRYLQYKFSTKICRYRWQSETALFESLGLFLVFEKQDVAKMFFRVGGSLCCDFPEVIFHFVVPYITVMRRSAAPCWSDQFLVYIRSWTCQESNFIYLLFRYVIGKIKNSNCVVV